MMCRRATLIWWAAVAIALQMAGPAIAQPAVDVDKLNAEVERLYRGGGFTDAIPLAERALALRKQALGPDHPSVAGALNNLAAVLVALGRLQEAEPLHLRSLEIRERVLGPDHRDVAESLNNLAGLRRAQGRYGEAVHLISRSLDILQKALGPDEPVVATSLNNLADLYRAQGRYGDAEPLQRRSLAIREKVLGSDHPDVAVSLNNLALLFEGRGRYAEAEALYKRSIAIRERALGVNHPDVATSLDNLASAVDEQGRFVEAEGLYKRSLAVRETGLGPDHPAVATSLNNLAVTFRRQSRHGEAEALYKRSIAIRERALGVDHFELGDTLDNLAVLYASQGRFREAEPLHWRGLAIRETALGPDHRIVATSLINLAELYREQGRYGDAEPLLNRAFMILQKALGEEHPDFATLLNNIALLLEAQRRHGDAELLYKRSIAISEKTFGADHYVVANSLNNLAVMYWALGRFAEAGPLLRRSLEAREKWLSPDHPDVAASLDNLAVLATSLNNWPGARDYWRRSTNILQRRAFKSTGDLRDATTGNAARRSPEQFRALVKVTERTSTANERNQLAQDTFETAQWALNSDAAEALASMAVRSAGGSPALAALVREQQDLIAEWRIKDRGLVASKSEQPTRRRPEAEKSLSVRLAAIDERLGQIAMRLTNEFPDYAALAAPAPISVADVQALLRSDEVLVQILDTDDRLKALPEETFVWVVTRTSVRWVRSALGTATLEREVAALRCGLDAAAWIGTTCLDLTGTVYSEDDRLAGKPLPFDHARAHKLYRSLFDGAEDLIAGKHLLVVPSGPLTRLPFQVLVTALPAGDDPRSIRWLARDHAISVLPSTASLRSLRRVGKRSAGSKPIIGFGNPLLDGAPTDPGLGKVMEELAERARGLNECARPTSPRMRGYPVARRSIAIPADAGTTRLARIKEQTPLPETADELCAVARALKADVGEVRLGTRATEAEIKLLNSGGRLSDYRIVHFATHGTLAGQLSGANEPGLILTPPRVPTDDDDGFLAASEIAGLKLDADWVILSACNTAAGAGMSGGADALSGIARAFFYAGARALLVSHWAVDSAATVKLITSALSAMAKDGRIGRAEALRRAMLSLIDTGTPELARTSHSRADVVVV